MVEENLIIAINNCDKIDQFAFQFRFLSNFYEAPEFDFSIEYEGLTYKNIEAAYQAQKTNDRTIKERFTEMNGHKAKKLGKKIEKGDEHSYFRKDWNDETKLKVMYDLLKIKFRNKNLKEMLLATGDKEIIEGNSWGDIFWGVCDGIGENHLGKLLMKVREELKKE